MSEIFSLIYFIGNTLKWVFLQVGELPTALQIIVFLIFIFVVWQFLGFVGELFRPNLNSKNKRYGGKIRVWGNPEIDYQLLQRMKHD